MNYWDVRAERAWKYQESGGIHKKAGPFDCRMRISDCGMGNRKPKEQTAESEAHSVKNKSSIGLLSLRVVE
jgi:hypothetical protein